MTSYPLAAAYIFFSFHLSGVSAPFYSNIALPSWGSTMSIFEHCKHPSAVAWVTADTQTVQPPSRRETWMFLRLLGEQPHSAEHHQWNECARGRPASCCPLLASQSAGRIELSWKGDFGPLQGYRIKLWSCVHATCSEDLQVPDCCPDTCGEPQVSPRHTPTTQIWENTSSTGFFWVEGGLIYRYRDKRIEPWSSSSWLLLRTAPLFCPVNPPIGWQNHIKGKHFVRDLFDFLRQDFVEFNFGEDATELQATLRSQALQSIF